MSDKTLGGRYRLTDQIGAKEGVDTYKAVDESGAVTAVELMRAPTAQDVTRLDRWAETMRGFDHPDLPHIFGYGAEGESFYVVREYVVGTNLKTLMAGGPLPVEKAVRYAIQVSEALRSANRMGLVHGDLRPHNIVVTHDDRVKVTEFQMPPAGGGLTARTSAAPESWHYASPEEVQGLPLTPTSDVYSLGVILYEMVTGRVPFDGETVAEVQGLHLTEVPTRPRALSIHVPAALDGVIMRALAKDPADRYQSFEAMRQDLLDVVASPKEEIVRAPGRAPEVAPAAVPEVITVPAYPVRRRRVWPWALLASLLAIALVAAIGAQFLLAPIGVPDLVGLTRAEAQNVLAAAGLTLGATIDQPAATARVGTVIAQNPRVDLRVRRGTAVDLTIGTLASITVPELAGQTQAEAIATLERAGLRAGAITFVITGRAPIGAVVGQSPLAGGTLAPDDEVAITVVRARGSFTVPSVVGLTEAEATSRLDDGGFSTIVAREFSTTVASGIVISQVPAAATRVGSRGDVTIVVSSGPLLVEVPNVIGLTRDDAVGALLRIGLNVTVSLEDTQAVLRSKVLTQYPVGGMSVVPRTRVRLTVAD